MYNNRHYFLVLSQSQSISEAANKLFVSQQYLSQYIRSLEDYYHAQLFVRRPKLKLTAAGKLVSAYYNQMQLLESDLFAKIDDQYNPVLNLGITYARASVLAPKLIHNYHQLYPKVKIFLFHDNSSVLEERLINSELDIYIGTTLIQKAELQYVPLIDERMFVVISEVLARQYFPDDWSNLERTFSTKHLSQLQELPFCISPDDVTTSTINSIHQITGAKINEIFSCYDPSVRIALCRSNFCATLIPESFLGLVGTSNRMHLERLHAYALHDYGMPYRLNIAYLKKKSIPGYLRTFISTTIGVANELMGEPDF